MIAKSNLICAVAVVLLALTSCGQESGSAPEVPELAGTWSPVELMGRDYATFQPVNGEATITLTPATGRWSGNDGCNEVYGSLKVDAVGQFRARVESGTDVGCDLSPRQELPNVIVVERATSWGLEQGRLILKAPDGTVIGVYRR